MGNPANDRRYTYLRKAIYSSLPLGTRLVYVVLDDHCGQQGKCWYRQSILAKKMDVSVRYLGQCIAALADRGLLRVEHSRNHAVYILSWSEAGRNQSAELAVVRSEPEFRAGRNQSSELEGSHLICDPQFLIRGGDPQCLSCGGSGVTGSTGADIKLCGCLSEKAREKSA